MKLSQINYKIRDRVEFELKDPLTNESFDNPAFITVLTIESAEGQKVKLDIERMRIQREKDKLPLLDSNELVNEARFLFKPLIVAFRGFEYEDGKNVKFDDKGIDFILQNDIVAMSVWANAINEGNFLVK